MYVSPPSLGCLKKGAVKKTREDWKGERKDEQKLMFLEKEELPSGTPKVNSILPFLSYEILLAF